MSPASLVAPDYSASGVSVRDDLRESHRVLLDHLRRPGSWFRGAERLAIAEESRHALRCALCRERKASLSPDHARGQHDRASDLPEPLVEVAHRVRTDAGRLSRAWFERMLASEGGPLHRLDAAAYVEAVGVVTLLAGLDYFCRALGVRSLPLPAPIAGEPSHHRPKGLRSGIAWVPMLAPEDATGPEADLYDKAAVIPNIARALSLVPDHVRMLQLETRSHYLPLSQISNPAAGRAIDRMQIELVAARVSALNECFY